MSSYLEMVQDVEQQMEADESSKWVIELAERDRQEWHCSRPPVRKGDSKLSVEKVNSVYDRLSVLTSFEGAIFARRVVCSRLEHLTL